MSRRFDKEDWYLHPVPRRFIPAGYTIWGSTKRGLLRVQFTIEPVRP